MKLAGMYENVRSCDPLCKGLSDEFEVKFGVHQGCVLLFIIVFDALSREIRRFQLTWNKALLSVFTRKRVMFGTEATTRGDLEIRGNMLFNRIAFIDCNENSQR